MVKLTDIQNNSELTSEEKIGNLKHAILITSDAD